MKFKKEQPAPPPEESFYAGSLALGVKVTIEQTPGTVVGAVHYTYGSPLDAVTWTSWVVEAGGRQRWITVVDEPTGPETVAWTPIEMPRGAQPGEATLEHNGLIYLHQDGGTARYRSEGAVELAREGIMEWHDYMVGRWRLSVERYDNYPWEASTGHVIPIGDMVVHR